LRKWGGFYYREGRTKFTVEVRVYLVEMSVEYERMKKVISSAKEGLILRLLFSFDYGCFLLHYGRNCFPSTEHETFTSPGWMRLSVDIQRFNGVSWR
jgi:hypothetical protein